MKTKTVYLDEVGEEYPPTYYYPEDKIIPHIHNSERMLAELLMDEMVFLNSRKYLCYTGKVREETLVAFLMCNDLFFWACADSESITLEELPDVYYAHIADPNWGTQKWVCFKRNMKPQLPVERLMKEAGVWCDKMEALPKNPST